MTMSNADWLTAALVIITAIYAWTTFRILRANESVVAAMQDQTVAQLRPYISVSVVPRIGTTLLSLEVINSGRSAATNVRLSMDRDFYAHAERQESSNIAKLPAFTNAIASLAPDARLQFILGVGGTIFAPGVDDTCCPKQFSVAVTYEFAGKAYNEAHKIDTRPMMHSAVLHDPVAEEIEKLRKAIEKIGSQMSKT